MDIRTARHIRIPEGNAIKIERNGAVLWKGLPPGFTPLQYIHGNGHACINTELHLTDEDSVKARVKITGTSNIFGCYTGTSARDNFSFYSAATSSGKIYARVDGQLDSSGSCVPNIEIDIFMDKTGAWVNDVQKAEFEDVEPFTASAPFYVGGLPNSTTSKIIGDIYALEVPGKFDGIPVQRDEDGICGLYDYVGCRFLSSMTSTEFTGGPPL